MVATELAEPLRAHHAWAVAGLPPRRAEQRLDDDVRASYPPFVRATLRDGRLVRDTLIAPSRAPFVRPPSEFRGEIAPAGTGGGARVAEAGRYHLFVSGVCPWASGARAVRALLGLQARHRGRRGAQRKGRWTRGKSRVALGRAVGARKVERS